MNIINLGILAHIDAGKTSVTENLLFASGATEKCGRVDNGDTITDSMDIEKREVFSHIKDSEIIHNVEHGYPPSFVLDHYIYIAAMVH